VKHYVKSLFAVCCNRRQWQVFLALKCWIEFLMKKIWFSLATLSDWAVFLVEICGCEEISRGC